LHMSKRKSLHIINTPVSGTRNLEMLLGHMIGKDDGFIE
jgi:hypothetical protein